MVGNQNNIAVIFAGGSGKRLWPLSTVNSPKQINQTFSKDSLLVDAYKRMLRLFPKENVVIVTTKQLAAATKKLLPQVKDKNIIVQPKNADTASAMCLTAMYLEALFPESTAVFVYSDHFIGDYKNFEIAITAALDSAQKNNRMVIIGTQPNFANTQFGYIKKGKRLSGDIFEVEDFIEKPSKSVAGKLLASKKWLWNTGIKAWRVQTLLMALKSAAPDIYDKLLDLRAEIGGKNYWNELEKWYSSLQSVSFESAIAERLPRLYVLEANYYWEDIGDWQTIYKLSAKDKAGNVIKIHDSQIPVRLVDAKNSLIMSTTKQKIALLDVDDIIIIQTDDALLVCRKEGTQRVKEVADL